MHVLKNYSSQCAMFMVMTFFLESLRVGFNVEGLGYTYVQNYVHIIRVFIVSMTQIPREY